MDERKKRRIGLFIFWGGFLMLMAGYYALYMLGAATAYENILEILAPALIVFSFPVFWLSIHLGTFDQPH